MPDEISLEQLDSFIQRNFAIVQEMLATAEQALSQCKLGTAAAYAQMAADYAWHNHPGLFYSERLERILTEIGCAGGRASRTVQPVCTPKRILHVMTQAYSTGGSTRFVWRWIKQDARRQHSAAITRQQEMRVPLELTAAVEGSGGKIAFIDQGEKGLLSRARRLADVASTADLVVLHVHPYDVVPSLAFAGESGPPVVFINHADHLFWVGRNASNMIAHIRHSGASLAAERRGIGKDHSYLLPIALLPIDFGDASRKAARQQLGLEDGTVVLLSTASAYKYAPMDGPSIIEALEPVLRRFAHAVLWIVGADGNEKWARNEFVDSGRVRLFGALDDPTTFYDAADIYLDSFPFASLTSLLEAALRGIPVVSYRSHPETCAVLCSDDPALSPELISCPTLGALVERLSELIQTPERRILAGMVAESVREIHVNRWSKTVEQLYAAASAAPHSWRVSPEETSACTDELNRRVALLHLKAGLTRDRASVARSQMGLLPWSSRLELFLKLSHSQRMSPHTLLSESTRFQLRRSWQKARQVAKLHAY